MEGTGQSCGLFRRNHNSVQVNSSRRALWVAATEPVFYTFYLLNPCPTCWRCQKRQGAICPCIFFFLCEDKVGGFHVISYTNSKSAEWKLPVTSKVNISMFDVYKHPAWRCLCFVSDTHFCILPQHPWQWIFLKLEHDTLRGVLYFLMLLWQMSHHPNNIDITLFFPWCLLIFLDLSLTPWLSLT